MTEWSMTVSVATPANRGDPAKNLTNSIDFIVIFPCSGGCLLGSTNQYSCWCESGNAILHHKLTVSTLRRLTTNSL
jgi:hypothetical protein